MISVEVSGQDRLTARVTRMRANIADLGPAFNRIGVYVRDRAIWRIKQQGGDQSWAPTRRGGHMGVLSGRMWQSIGVYQTSPNEITVGVNVRTADGRYNYARIFQEGHPSFEVHAKGRALRFTVGGTVYFRKNAHAGAQPARRFLLIGEQERAFAHKVLIRHVLALEEGSDAATD